MRLTFFLAAAAWFIGQAVVAGEKEPLLVKSAYQSGETLARLNGREVFMEKCWGCHHEVVVAFGPSFRWISLNRTESQVRLQLQNPAQSALKLGYKRSAMPVIPLTPEQTDKIVDYIRYAGKKASDTND